MRIFGRKRSKQLGADQISARDSSPSAVNAQLNIRNVDFMLDQPRRSFRFLRFDSTNNCNLQCVYCHNPRSKEHMDLEKIRVFFNERVDSVENLTYGCVMEPTLDKRMTDIMGVIAESPGRPQKRFMLQTNGLLLHLHDYQAMKAAGLNRLSVSVDSASTETFKQLRGGASLNKVTQNLQDFRGKCPDVLMQFMITVNTANADELDQLLEWGIDLGINRFVFREMFFHPESKIVNHAAMHDLLLPAGRFTQIEQDMTEKFQHRTQLFFSSCETLRQHTRGVRSHSLPPTKPDKIRGAIGRVIPSQAEINIYGWLLLPDGAADSIDILSNSGHVVSGVQCNRPDILQSFPKLDRALQSGFEVTLPEAWFRTDGGHEFILEANRRDEAVYRCRIIREKSDRPTIGPIRLSGNDVVRIESNGT